MPFSDAPSVSTYYITTPRGHRALAKPAASRQRPAASRALPRCNLPARPALRTGAAAHVGEDAQLQVIVIQLCRNVRLAEVVEQIGKSEDGGDPHKVSFAARGRPTENSGNGATGHLIRMWREELQLPHARRYVLCRHRSLLRFPPAGPLAQFASVDVQQAFDGVHVLRAASGRLFARGHLLEQLVEDVRPVENGFLLPNVPV